MLAEVRQFDPRSPRAKELLRIRDAFEAGELDDQQQAYRSRLLEALARAQVNLTFVDGQQWPERRRGWADADSRSMNIRTGMPPRIELLTLIHESLHIVFGHSDPDLEPASPQWDLVTEPMEIQVAAAMLTASAPLGEGHLEHAVIDVLEAVVGLGRAEAQVAGEDLDRHATLERIPHWTAAASDRIESDLPAIQRAAQAVLSGEITVPAVVAGL